MEEPKKTASVPNFIGGTAPNGQIGRRDSEISEAECKPTVIMRKGSSASIQGDSQIPKRLSQLFFPPGDELLEKEDETNESSLLLGDLNSHSRKGAIVPAKPQQQPQPAPPQQQQQQQHLPKPPSTKEVLDKDLVQKPKSPPLAEEDDVSLSILDQIQDVNPAEDSDGAASDHATSASTSSRASSDSEEEEESQAGLDRCGASRDADCTSWDDTICSNRSAYFKHYYQKNLSALGSNRAPDGTTSHTSLVSLIREKSRMAEKSSDEKKKKKKEDIGLMVLVIFLFLVLVIGISLIYHFYNIHLEELSLFKRLKFNEEGRILNLLDSNGNMDIQARLGTTLPPYAKPEDCTHYLQYFYKYQVAGEDDSISTESIIRSNKTATDFIIKRKRWQNEFQFDDETVCLDWANQARLQIHKAPSRAHVNCYNVFWSAQRPGTTLRDCMLIGIPEHGVWWGIGEITGGGFPLESNTWISSAPLVTGNLGKHSFGRVLRRTFMSSFGGLLILPDHLPASVSVNPNELCISMNTSNSANPSVPVTLNYTICSSPNISSTIDYLHHLARGNKYFAPLSSKDKKVIKERIMERLENPVWIPYKEPNRSALTQESVLSYVDGIMGGNQSVWGHVLLPLSWQSKTGDLDFDPVRFPDPKAMVDAIVRKGFRLALTISPLVSTDTNAFRNRTTEGFWVQQKGSALPALIQYGDVAAGALTDFTNPRASAWFVAKLTAIKDKYDVDRFHLDPPDSHSIPRYHEFNQAISNPDLALQPFVRATMAVSAPLSTESIISPPPLPIFVAVGDEDSAWKSLASLVPRILTLSTLGFPLVDAGVVGGTPSRAGNVPDHKLFIRWFQAAAFLPAYQMNVLPQIYDDATQAILADVLAKRRAMVLPRLTKAVAGTFVNNTPLIFPLGILYPEDIEAASVGDEWILGDDLLVAPILHKDKMSRDIYIPAGLWESQLDGRLKKGPGWIRDYKVPLSDVAHFLKRYTM